MPTRTYSGISLINYVVNSSFFENYVAGSGSLTVSQISPGVVTISGSATGASTVVNAFELTQTDFAPFFSIEGDLDFDQIPAIPENATITEIDVSVVFRYNILASYTNCSGGVASVSGELTFSLGGSVLGSLSLGPDTDSSVDPANDSVQVQATRTGSTHHIIDLTPGITKAQLVTDYTSVSIDLPTFAATAVDGAPIVGGGGSLTVSVIIENFEILVTYTDPGINITLDPPGGTVKPGQYITATGPGAADATYAATNGDQVIPLIPKVIGPDEVELEIPSPDPDCDDCFDDCPECEDCLVPCNEDLTGEDCVECLEACLECMTLCLDDLEAAEACIGSTDGAPPFEIVIICDPGTQFGGSVPLGNFTVLEAEASGIYELVDGKTNDTLYTPARDGTTYNVKIPNPNGKTGFFRS